MPQMRMATLSTKRKPTQTVRADVHPYGERREGPPGSTKSVGCV